MRTFHVGGTAQIKEESQIISQTKGKLNGESFNIGNGKNYSVNEVADMLGGEKTYGEKRLEPYETLADNTKAKDILGWTPIGDLPTWIKKYKKDLGL